MQEFVQRLYFTQIVGFMAHKRPREQSTQTAAYYSARVRSATGSDSGAAAVSHEEPERDDRSGGNRCRPGQPVQTGRGAENRAGKESGKDHSGGHQRRRGSTGSRKSSGGFRYKKYADGADRCHEGHTNRGSRQRRPDRHCGKETQGQKYPRRCRSGGGSRARTVCGSNFVAHRIPPEVMSAWLPEILGAA